ncbi:MAG: nickel-dependent hydrogenase large subunit [Thermofilaceae archaeon]
MEVERRLTRLPFGPVHPATKEPALLMLTVDGERVVDVELRLGYVYRGIEALAQARNIIQVLHLVERVCGICSHAHPLCYVQAVESIAGIEPCERSLYIRTVVAELERIQSHLLWIGVLGYQLGFIALFMYAWRIRESVLDVLEEMTGNRIMKEVNAIGGVRSDLSDQVKAKIEMLINDVRKSATFLFDVIHDKTVESRLAGVGGLSRNDSISTGAVGPTARASGVDFDVRRDYPYAAYEELKGSFSVAVLSGGDALSRTEVRVAELIESANLLEAALDTFPSGRISPPPPPHKVLREVPEGEAVAKVEAPRGELFYYVRTDGKGFLKRLRIRTPTLANLSALTVMLKDLELADVPAVYISIDPCISCTERVLVIDARSGVWRETNLMELEKRCSEAC